METELTRLQKLQQRQADLQLKIRREQQKLARDERRRDTRRKILAGAIALSEAEENQDWAKRLMNRLDEKLDRNGDRELFGLKPRPPRIDN